MTAPPCTALVVSKGCVTMEEACADTFTLCCAAAGFSVTLMARAELTITVTAVLASAKPAARTVS